MMVNRRKVIQGIGLGLGAGIAGGGTLASHLAFAQAQRVLKFQLLGFTLSIHVPSYAAVHDILPSMGYGTSSVTRIKQIRIATQNMVAGTAELGETDPPTVLRAAEAGADLKIIGHFYNNTTLVLVANSDKVKSAEDLAKPGIRIAIASKGDVTHVVLVGPMQNRGIDPDKLTFVEMAGSGTRMRALLADRVDASLIHFDQAERVAKQGNFKVVIEPHKEYPVWVNEVWVANGAWLANAQNRRAAVDVLKATLIAFRRANDDLDWFTDKYRKFASFKNSKDATPEQLRPVWEALRGPINAWPKDMGFNVENFRGLLPAYKASGAIAGTVDLDSVVQTQYVEQALDELGG
jgi:NitT/TauT family transport system substrate-binding protein